MKRIGILISLAIAIVLLALPAHSATCSNATLKGAYGTQDTQDDGFGSRYDIVALMKFDGTGHGTVSFEAFHRDDGTINVNTAGFIISYAVAPDCTFTFTHDAILNNGLTFSGVIVNDAKELRYVETSGIQFRLGSAVKVSTQNQQ